MDLSSIGLAGAKEAEARLEQAGRRIARATSPDDTGSDAVALTEAAVQIAEAVNSYRANLQLVRTADEVAKKTIDQLA